MKTLLEAGKDCKHDWLATGLFAEIVASASLWSRTVTRIVDYWLDESRLGRVAEIVGSDSPGSDGRILECVREALSELFLNVALTTADK